MELVYLWVEEYKNIKKQGFNFSPKFNCKYDEEKEKLTINENEDYLEDFFSDNINITAIVGENGSGKSNLVELILHIEHWSTSTTKLFCITSGNKEFKLHHLNFETDIKCSKTILQQRMNRGERDRDSAMSRQGIGINFSYLSLSPFLHGINTFYSHGNVDFFSIYNYHDGYQNHNFNYDDFFLSMIPKIPELLENDYVSTFFNIGGKPNYLIFEISKEVDKHFSDEVKKILENSIKKNESKNLYVNQIKINNSLIINDLKKLYQTIENKKHSLLTKKYELEKQLKKDMSKGFIPELKKSGKSEFDKQYDELYNIPYGNTGNEKSTSQIINRMTTVKTNRHSKELEKINKDIENLVNIQFYFAQEKDSNETFFFSAGELVLLFYIDKLLQIAQKEKNLTLLIDESELHLHPDWQKKFLNLLYQIFNQKEYKRNIGITSHSCKDDGISGTMMYIEQIEKIKTIQKEKMKNLKVLKASILDRAFKGEL